MSDFDNLVKRMVPTGEAPEPVEPSKATLAAASAMAGQPVAPVGTVTASKAKWGSILPTILGGALAPFTAQALPEHILADMDFWKYLVWIVAQAAIFYGATFLNIYQAPPNSTK